MPEMPELTEVPKGVQAVIVTPKAGDSWSPADCRMLNERADAWKRALGCNVVFMSVPIEVHPVPDNTVQYGIKDAAGRWQQKPDGIAASGTKAEMLATLEALQPHSQGWTVAPLPTE